MADRFVVCFDFEGSYGMPHTASYDLSSSTASIVRTLADRDAQAVFFVVGRMVEEHPAVVEQLAAAGHEVALHGYEHDDHAQYSDARVAWLGERVAAVGDRLETLVGRRPRGFRAPYLLGPRFHDPRVYRALGEAGITWVSNREVRYPVELVRPGRIPLPGHASLTGPTGPLVRSKAVLVALNAGLVARETFAGSPAGRLRWLVGRREPFLRDGLVELPLYSPLDCDLLGLPAPDEQTPAELLGYAVAAVRSAAQQRGTWSMTTFHDWIVAGGNRLCLLEHALDAARAVGAEISTPQEHPEWLGAVA